MKLSPEEKSIMDKMQAGILSTDGFLGNDQRHLHEIIEEDAEKLLHFNYSLEQIAERMRYFTEMSREAYDLPVVIEGKYAVQQDIWRGRVVCPYNHKGSYVKADIRLKNLENQIEVRWTPLNIHFIEVHGFFEGIGSKYRLNPETLIKAIF
ncbi:MAG: hypothetical protein KA886_01610 [Candidatus Cloacimonetes bacterium]|nr:hypothetical protein [Candidatus Cloacimonadota bacterium]